MSTVKNKTPKPLKIRLSHGKVLRLGPGKEGQIADKDEEIDSVTKLIEAGELELVGGGRSKASAGDGAVPTRAGGGPGHSGGKQNTSRGDR